MKVAYIVAEYPSVTETFIAREVEAVYDAGVNVCIFSLKPFNRERDNCPRNRSFEWVRYSPHIPSPCSLGIHLLGFFRSMPSYLGQMFHAFFRHRGYGVMNFGRKLLFFHRTISLAHTIRREGITHLHAQFAHLTAEVGREAARLEHVHFSVGTHAWDIFGQSAEKALSYLEGADFITCCHQKGLKRLRRILPEEQHGKLVLVRHGLPCARLQLATAGKGHLLLAVGRLVPKKGFCHLLEACDLMRSAGIDFECLIVGDGQLRKPLEKMIEILDLHEHVRLVGEMSNAAVHKLMTDETAVFCLPSVIDDTGDHDGLPNVILEAMCAALPVVTTTANSADEAIENGKNGIIVPQQDPEDLAHHIGRLLVNPDLRRQMGRAARQTVLDHFSSQGCIRPLLKQFALQAETCYEVEGKVGLEAELAG